MNSILETDRLNVKMLKSFNNLKKKPNVKNYLAIIPIL